MIFPLWVRNEVLRNLETASFHILAQEPSIGERGHQTLDVFNDYVGILLFCNFFIAQLVLQVPIQVSQYLF